MFGSQHNLQTVLTRIHTWELYCRPRDQRLVKLHPQRLIGVLVVNTFQFYNLLLPVQINNNCSLEYFKSDNYCQPSSRKVFIFIYHFVTRKQGICFDLIRQRSSISIAFEYPHFIRLPSYIYNSIVNELK